MVADWIEVIPQISVDVGEEGDRMDGIPSSASVPVNNAVSNLTLVHETEEDERLNENDIDQKPNEFSDWERRLANKRANLHVLKRTIVNRHKADRTLKTDLWKRILIDKTYTWYVPAQTVVMSALIQTPLLCSYVGLKEEICRFEHERARPLFGDLPERYWASRYIVPDVPQIRMMIIPRLKKQYRGKALGPSKLRFSFIPEFESTGTFEEPPAKVPHVCAPDDKPSASESTSFGSVEAVSPPSYDASSPVGQSSVNGKWENGMIIDTDSGFSFNIADLPVIPDEEDMDSDVRDVCQLPADQKVPYKGEPFYRCSEVLLPRPGAMALLPMPVCAVA